MINAYDLTFDRNSVQHKILSALCDGVQSSQGLITRYRMKRDISGMRLTLADLQRRGFIRSVGFDQWLITNDGMDAYLTLGGKPTEATRRRQASNKVELFLRPVYDAKELGDNCDRPGAYDYRKHPSLTANRRVWYGPGLKPVREQALR